MKKRRPRGVVFIAAVNIFIGVLLFLCLISITLKILSDRNYIALVLVVPFLLLSLAYAGVGVRTLRLNPKVKRDNVSLALISIAPLLMISTVIVSIFPSLYKTLNLKLVFFMTVVWFFIVAFYFTRPKVKEQFK